MGHATRETWSGSRYVPDDPAGHYESWFQRANHPERPLAFWIRYTLFSPKDRPRDAVGELWAIWFDGEAQRVTACKQVVSAQECRFHRSALDVAVGGAALDGRGLVGAASGQGHRVDWSLRYTSPEDPLLLLPRGLYGAPFPKAKALVGSPNAVFDGTITVDGEPHEIHRWVGSQNHNWGVKHTDKYAWGQVAGFDGAPDSFFELGTARVKLGPLWTPWMTVMVLRLDGEELPLNTLRQSVRAQARYDYFCWRFESANDQLSVSGTINAPRWAFVGLPYDNPPGGRKTCLNTKIASCHLTVRRPGRAPRSLVSQHRAAFEILTDDVDHGVPVLDA